MSTPQVLTLDEDDPRVVAARNAEQQLFAFYGLEAQTRFIRLPGSGLRLRLTEVGSGKPVLFVPGNNGDTFPLASLMAELPGRRIIAVNRPGGGMSEGMDHRTIDLREFAVETLVAVLDALEFESAPLIAHSIGGHWSLWLALEKPERVTALTLLGVPGSLLNTCPPFALRLLSVPHLNGLLFHAIMSRSTSDQAFKSLSFIGHPQETCARLPKALADCFAAFQQLPHARVSILSLMEQTNRLRGARPDITLRAEQLKRVQQPTMFLWGTNDPFGSVETGRQIARLMPNAEFHAIQHGGHLPWLDAPAECGRLIQDFLSGY